MSQITAIRPQVKDKTRCNIEVDGRFCCGLKLETVVKNGLKVGSSVTEEGLSKLQLESEKQTALDKALTHLTASMKPEREVRAYLAGKGYLPEVCDHVIEKLKSYGYVDDFAYAKAYAEGASGKKGPRLIALELKKKGVPEQAIEAVLSDFPEGGETALALLRKYLRGKDVTDPKVLRKAYAHLHSKGFDYDAAREALSALASDDD